MFLEILYFQITQATQQYYPFNKNKGENRKEQGSGVFMLSAMQSSIKYRILLMARYRTIENLLRRPINQQKSITVYHNLAQIFLTKNAYLQYSDCRCYQVSNINMKKYLL